MKVNRDTEKWFKLCHMRPGEVFETETHEICLVALEHNAVTPSIWPTEGLYKATGVIFINLETGKQVFINLFQRVKAYRNASMYTGEAE